MVTPALLAELDVIAEPGPLMAELYRRFPGRTAIATSGQPTDTALIALAVEAGVRAPRVYTNDTYRLFPETYAYFDAVEKAYSVTIERFFPPEKELKSMIDRHGEFLFFDSKDKQEYCCHVRKVLPNAKALDTLDVWITGLRRDQSKAREHMPRMEIIAHAAPGGTTRSLLKVSPLAAWTEAHVRDYLKSVHAPMHQLMDKPLPNGWYYESLGCVVCTTPIGPHEPRRAGRWRWFNALDDKKECGLHLPETPTT